MVLGTEKGESLEDSVIEMDIWHETGLIHKYPNTVGPSVGHRPFTAYNDYYQGSYSEWKTWKNGKSFSNRGKSENFEQTGKVRENHFPVKKTGKVRDFQTNAIYYLLMIFK